MGTILTIHDSVPATDKYEFVDVLKSKVFKAPFDAVTHSYICI